MMFLRIKKIRSLVCEEKKFNSSLVFITQSYFNLPKTRRLNATHYFIIKILSNRELQQIVSSHSSDIEFKDL